jgi:Flp pilus assembly protein TadD
MLAISVDPAGPTDACGAAAQRVRLRWQRASRMLRRGLMTCVAALAGACASPQALLKVPMPFEDAAFAPSTLPLPSRESLFALSPAMQAYAHEHLRMPASGKDSRRELIAALYEKQRLRIDYEASITRDAAATFDTRSGNCLSLVIMTAAFARHLDIPVSYQAVLLDDFHSRSGDLQFVSGHVNLVLSPRALRPSRDADEPHALVVDFLPQIELRGVRTKSLTEATIVAMYFNNRAAELLAEGQVTAAYWAARRAVQEDPSFSAALNTLGVVYTRHRLLAAAEQAFRRVLEQEVFSVSALTNLQRLLVAQGRSAEAEPIQARLAQLQPVTPFDQLTRGQKAMVEGRHAQALELFVRELRLQPFQDEAHFWAAQAYWRLGEGKLAERHLQYARDFSRTRSAQQRYGAKLEHLRAQLPLNRVQ